MLTSRQLFARYQACEEAADHLGMGWTDDEVEFAEAKVVAAQLRRQAQVWHNRAVGVKEREQARMPRGNS